MLKLGEELEKMLSAYQNEISRLKRNVEALASMLEYATEKSNEYQKKYVLISYKTGVEVCPICDNGIVSGCNSEELPCGLNINHVSICSSCGGEGVFEKNKTRGS